MAFTERSAAARRAILAAARESFATTGYEQSTIRSIAAAAGVHSSMVIRYFGSKSDLFVATVANESPIPEVGDLDDFGARFARRFVEYWEGSDCAGPGALLRVAPTHQDAAEQVQAVFDRLIAGPVRVALAGDPDVERRVALLVATAVGFVYTRHILRLEPVASIPPEALVPALAATFQSHLTGPLAAEPAGRGDEGRGRE
ncbi:TetR family transcriptional regulator [Actinocatenispora thailandica]|uniref:TetR family transcriptional regulator n=1 Tax=Actinocatenispora thailandica TaxID=227318 RepID=A0A7R7I0X7_9ACTN|nr:TetR family transcriptional regulator [Actinocatenispora thailandica]BCJ39066.1 TetR family transcriptional regulator [Actinocatenispora thailandica]